MSSFPADGAMEAICFFEPRNGNVFRYGPVAERLSSLPVFRHVTCCFDASNAAGRFQLPCPEQKKSMMRAAGVHLMWSGEWAGRSRWPLHPAARPGQSRRVGRRVHRPDAFGTTLLARDGRAQGYGNQSMIDTSAQCHHMRGRGRTRRCVNPRLQCVSDPTSANRGARAAAR
jgi:hypothetical protein